MRIVNGKLLGDSLGYYTFFNTNGKNTVDYIIVYIYIYMQTLLGQKGISEIVSLNSLLDDDKFDDIDLLVEKNNDIYIQAAKKSTI